MRVVDLNTYALRDYQVPVFDAIEKEGCKRVVLVASRRSGKDFLSWVLAIRQACKKVCLVMYALPTFSQARRAVWDAITIDGRKFKDLIPKELIANINNSEMKLTFTNGSILQLIGGDSFDTSLVGCNPYAIILSEMALMDPRALDYATPILAANGGWLLAQSTPRGHNAFHDLFKRAQDDPFWRVFVQPASQIKHISEEALEQERRRMSESLYAQEYECSFDKGIDGSYYGREVDALKNSGQIGPVAWDPSLLVHTTWDIGVDDSTAIIFWQMPDSGLQIRVIDYYENTNFGLDHYAKFIQDKPYKYGKHWGPHDIRVREWGGGAISRREKARQLGIEFQVLSQQLLEDGIENARTHFNKMFIDERKCARLISALENYYREYDDKNEKYKDRPVKNWACHGADAFRYMCQAINLSQPSLSGEEYDKLRKRALYGQRTPYGLR